MRRPVCFESIRPVGIFVYYGDAVTGSGVVVLRTAMGRIVDGTVRRITK